MNLGELRQEVKDRGFDHVDDDRIDRWINQAVREINDLENWYWLETYTTGTPPFPVPDLRTVLWVRDKNRTGAILEHRDPRDLAAELGDLAETGTPRYYYLEVTALKVWPIGGLIEVGYLSTGAVLDDDSDEPTIPSSYHDLIVTGAVRKAYLDSDGFDEANVLRAEWQLGVDGMRNALLDRQDDGPDQILLAGPYL